MAGHLTSPMHLLHGLPPPGHGHGQYTGMPNGETRSDHSKFLVFEVCWFQCCLVSWFQVSWFVAFSVPWFLGFEVCWLQRFLVCWKMWIPYYHNSISCSQEDIAPLSKIFKNILNRPSGFPGAHVSNMFILFETGLVIFITNNTFQKWFGSSKDKKKKKLVLGLRGTSQNPKK